MTGTRRRFSALPVALLAAAVVAGPAAAREAGLVTGLGPAGPTSIVYNGAELLAGETQPALQPAAAKMPRHEGDRSSFAGSKTCRDCHADFYKLWATSFHGLAMQPYTPALGRKNLSPQTAEIVVGKTRYQARIDERGGRVRQRGPDGDKEFPIEQVMGGKNVYYFLTPLERGRLQVLPVAYDVHKRAWYDTAASGVRHFPDRRDEALLWTDRMFTFNTTCFNCHVSQLRTNYDLAGDAYKTTWSEPGISCEACHGPGSDHVRAMETAADPAKVHDLKIIRAKEFTAERMNDLCATCHAKLVPLSLDFRPGDKFFDHFDLVVLDHPDFYPDGRDLGENYTYTSWLLGRCGQSGKLDCNHCHTPSGRVRFEGAEANKSCAPCHQKYLDDPVAHGHHVAGSKGNDCVGCHMPMTRFAAMGRSDHSMRPPTPAATVAYKSPNACNLCHADHDAAWSDEWVRKWYKADYQAETLRRAELIDLARKRQWRRLPDMLAELAKKDGNEVYKTALVRLLRGCEDQGKWPVLVGLLQDPSPLVRSAAASELGGHLTPEVLQALLAAAADPSRLVRIRTAMSLAALPPEAVTDERVRASLDKANREFATAMRARPDDWASHANLGNFYMEGRNFPAAAVCFETATRLEPRQIGPLVNASLAYSNMDQNDKAERSLQRALKIEPANAAANFNLGLLLAEKRRLPEAEQALRAALKADPQMAAAAYNLGVLLADKSPDEAVAWCRKAHELLPGEPKYAHTLAFFLRQKGNVDEAIQLLRQVIRHTPLYLDAYLLLGEIHEQRHDISAAAAVYRDALKLEQLPPQLRRELESKLRAIDSRNR